MRIRSAVALCLLSAVLGAAVIPANADTQKKLERRLSKAEAKIAALTGDLAGTNTALQVLTNRVGSVEGRLSSAESKISSYSTRFLNVESDIDAIERQTSKLSTFGAYSGKIGGHQVEPPFFCAGKPAIWGGFFSELDC